MTGMTLNQYLVVEDISSREFAKRLSVSISAVRKWRQDQRMPKRSTVKKIFRITRGKVHPFDWYSSKET